MLLLKDQHLVALPKTDAPGLASALDFTGLDDLLPIIGRVSLSLSPCRRLLVGMALQRSSRAEDHQQSVRKRLAIRRASKKLWHGHIHTDQKTCVFSPISASFMDWWPETLAWHPCPGDNVVYAIWGHSHDLFLMDGKRNVCIKSWSWRELCNLAGNMDLYRAMRPMRLPWLCWAPDGSRLAFFADNCVVVLTFGDT